MLGFQLTSRVKFLDFQDFRDSLVEVYDFHDFRVSHF